ncbi:hypothetical protein GCM10009759_74870 [Kitasatospora saccharophila]|uniref:Uncharacterized protein n=1 Tax=Kitasatospora saccharophila TaxID=407973 RepID=A0ABP5K086_9ACTN
MVPGAQTHNNDRTPGAGRRPAPGVRSLLPPRAGRFRRQRLVGLPGSVRPVPRLRRFPAFRPPVSRLPSKGDEGCFTAERTEPAAGAGSPGVRS